MKVFVLLFNARTENEGIHTIKVIDADRQERDVVLMFESEDDATRFGLMLEAQDFPMPTVEVFDSQEIEEFCQQADYEYELIPKGALALPPESNVDETDWQKGRKPKDDVEIPQTELDRIRKRLEGLL